MEETKEQQGLHRGLQFCIYLSVFLDLVIFIHLPQVHFLPGGITGAAESLLITLSRLMIYQQPLYSRCFTILLVLLVSIGTLAKKERDLNAKYSILYPLALGGGMLAAGLFIFSHQTGEFISGWWATGYGITELFGVILLHIALDNISKIISSKLGKDRWNVEEESFMQDTREKTGPFQVSIPSLFYYRGKVRKGYINIENIFRGTLLIGTPGSGKSFGVVMPFIRQLMAKEFCICLYDFKFPDLSQLAYAHYLSNRSKGKLKGHDFHVINLNDVEKSRRLNVLRPDYIQTLADASETAEALIEALKKGDKSGGSDQFFTQSAVNFLSACIYFFSRYQSGRYSSLPHVLSFLNASYDQIFSALLSNPELHSLLSPFMSAYRAKAFDQLEGQVGTLKIFISRLATKETFWVFSGDDFSLKISDPSRPAMLVLANDPNTQNINSACYSVVLNRLTRLINSKGNLPSALLLDELPTIFVHRIENLIATARSNKVAVLMGLQELPQFHQHYGKEVSATICSVVGNVLSGSVRNKETLDWLEKLFGKIKQTSESLSIDRSKTSISLSERLEHLIPAGKISALRTGELVGILAREAASDFDGNYLTSAVNCRVNLDMVEIEKESANYPAMPIFYDFKGKKSAVLLENFNRINAEVTGLLKRFPQV
ncbi:type IV secretory system conjugative DNA transfer family protein [Pedobacter frigidisoli]|uniref:Type IV secretory system conjugative DNA transfer family protein n=1 Tax=Pedobacter frigidisoli TaxID=2530455 RepID=A0A4R0P250_9SPHI|nr:type IV secretory system conjugative DNA transfer family protein [Pedobacter frigidisoli]TCD07697.1 type IV secretory system conjugative DNA transfer family protein [Pedobacter frigidisoli]